MFRVTDKIHVQNPVCVQLLDNVSWCHTHGWYEQLSVALDNNVDELVEVTSSVVDICLSCRSSDLREEQVDAERKGWITKMRLEV